MILSALDFLKDPRLPAPVIGLVPGDPLIGLWVRRHLLEISGIPEDGADAAIDLRTGEELAHFKILGRLRERSLFGSRRILWISRADQSQEIDPADLLARNQKTMTTVVLEAPTKILSSWSDTIPSYDMALPPPETPGSTRKPWVLYLAKKHGLAVDESAMEPILTTFTRSLGPIDGLFREIARNAFADGIRTDPQIRVTAALLKKAGVESHYRKIFDLVKKLEAGDKQFLREWDRFLANAESPFAIIGILAKQWRSYRTNYQGREESREGSIPAAAFRQGVEALWEADFLLKHGGAPGVVMDTLAATLLPLMAPPKKGPRKV